MEEEASNGVRVVYACVLRLLQLRSSHLSTVFFVWHFVFVMWVAQGVVVL